MFAATKAGVTGFTRSFARSVAPHIRVNEVAPGWIATAFAETAMAPEYRANVIAQTPMARFGTPEDVAAAALFLCSEEAAFITGQTLKVNGGLSWWTRPLQRITLARARCEFNRTFKSMLTHTSRARRIPVNGQRWCG